MSFLHFVYSQIAASFGVFFTGFVLGLVVVLCFWWWDEESWRFDEYPWYQKPFVVLLGPTFAFIGAVCLAFAGFMARVQHDSTRK